MDGKRIEPFGEAFGNNVELISVNRSAPSSSGGPRSTSDQAKKTAENQDPNETSLILVNQPTVETNPDDRMSSKLLNFINKLDGNEAIDRIETIMTKDVEQGKCASFKKIAMVDEKKFVNEPGYSHVSFYNDTTSLHSHSAASNNQYFLSFSILHLYILTPLQSRLWSQNQLKLQD